MYNLRTFHNNVSERKRAFNLIKIGLWPLSICTVLLSSYIHAFQRTFVKVSGQCVLFLLL